MALLHWADHSVFQLIIDEIDKMNCSFDPLIRAVYQKYQDKCYVCQPNRIIADVSTSDIRSGLNQEEYSATMKWDPSTCMTGKSTMSS